MPPVAPSEEAAQAEAAPSPPPAADSTEAKAAEAPPSVEAPPAPAPAAAGEAADAPAGDAAQLMRDIFGDSGDEDEEAPAPAEDADADEEREKAAHRLESVKKKKQRSEDKPKKSRKSEKEKKEKKKRRAEEPAEDGAPDAAAAAASDDEKYTSSSKGKAKPQRELGDFDRVVESLKRTNRRKRDEAADEAARAYVKDLLTRMQSTSSLVGVIRAVVYLFVCIVVVLLFREEHCCI